MTMRRVNRIIFVYKQRVGSLYNLCMRRFVDCRFLFKRGSHDIVHTKNLTNRYWLCKILERFFFVIPFSFIEFQKEQSRVMHRISRNSNPRCTSRCKILLYTLVVNRIRIIQPIFNEYLILLKVASLYNDMYLHQFYKSKFRLHIFHH